MLFGNRHLAERIGPPKGIRARGLWQAAKRIGSPKRILGTRDRRASQRVGTPIRILAGRNRDTSKRIHAPIRVVQRGHWQAGKRIGPPKGIGGGRPWQAGKRIGPPMGVIHGGVGRWFGTPWELVGAARPNGAIPKLLGISWRTNQPKHSRQHKSGQKCWYRSRHDMVPPLGGALPSRNHPPGKNFLPPIQATVASVKGPMFSLQEIIFITRIL